MLDRRQWWVWCGVSCPCITSECSSDRLCMYTAPPKLLSTLYLAGSCNAHAYTTHTHTCTQAHTHMHACHPFLSALFAHPYPPPSQAAPYTGQFFDANERHRLTGLVDYQTQELQALKEEIRALQLKGSHVLPPMQPPVPTGPHR